MLKKELLLILVGIIFLFLCSFKHDNHYSTSNITEFEKGESFNYSEMFNISRPNIPPKAINITGHTTPQMIIDSLLTQKKSKCIHHDNFFRTDNIMSIGSNSEKNDVLSYELIQYGNDEFSVGIKDNMLVNVPIHGSKTIKIFAVDTKKSNYTATIVRSSKTSTDARLAFCILDSINFYWARLTPSELLVYHIKNGEETLVKSQNGFNGNKALNIRVTGNFAECKVDDKLIFEFPIYNNKTTKCGPCFYSASESCVDNFFVEIDDYFLNTEFDDLIESGSLESSKIGVIESPQQSYNLNIIDSLVCNSSKSLRFDLLYSDNVNFGKYRVEICPKRRDTKALDSWIFSFDVYLPFEYISDFVSTQQPNIDVICQIHDSGPNLDPPFAIYIKGNELYCIVRGHNSRTPNRKEIKPYSIKIANITYGQWMNVVIYLREGYEPVHKPKTMVWINGIKKVDINVINSYNTTNYLKFGDYKPIWHYNPTTVNERILYFDNINYWN